MKAGMPGSGGLSCGPVFPHVRLAPGAQFAANSQPAQETTVGLHDLIYPIFVEEKSRFRPDRKHARRGAEFAGKNAGAEIEKFYRAGIAPSCCSGFRFTRTELGSETWIQRPACKDDSHLETGGSRDGGVSDTCFCDTRPRPLRRDRRRSMSMNDQTLQNYRQAGCEAAAAGADMIAPSAMMDGRRAIRQALTTRHSSTRRSWPIPANRLLLLRPVPRRRGCD